MSLVPGISDKTLDALIREAALGYYTPEEMARVLQIDPAVQARLLRTPIIQNRVADLQRGFVESGEKFRLTAKHLAAQIIEQVAADALHEDHSPSERLKAAELLVKWAGLAPTDAGAAVNVEINLGPALDDAYGRLDRVRVSSPVIDHPPNAPDSQD